MKVLEPEMIFPNEEIVHITGYHWIYVFRSFFPFVLVLIIGTIAWGLMPTRATSVITMIALIASIVWIVIKVLDTVVKRCYVTNRRLINRSGWTKRDTQDVTLDRIGGIFLDQTPIERFLGYGRIRLIVPVIQIPLPVYLRNPIAFRNALYMKPKEAEKPDDDVLEAAEHDRVAKEQDDRFGTETVSFKDLREATNELESPDFSSDVSAEASGDLDAVSEEAFAETTSDDGVGDSAGDGSAEADGGADGGEEN